MRILSIVGVAFVLLSSSVFAADKTADTSQKTKGGKKKDKSVVSLFDGKSLKGWKSTNFGGEGEVLVKDGSLVLEMGSDLTGVTWADAKALPKSNYEITFQAMRVDGFDFFCGLTVPVRDGYCSLICGGWGGGVCGISCIDGYDASENDTTSYREFKSKKWYKIRLRVTDEKINAWIDDEEIVDQDIRDHKLAVRLEVDLSKPLGFCSWQTTAALKDIKLRRLSKDELKKKPANKS